MTSVSGVDCRAEAISAVILPDPGFVVQSIRASTLVSLALQKVSARSHMSPPWPLPFDLPSQGSVVLPADISDCPYQRRLLRVKIALGPDLADATLLSTLY